jgi:hypothetical protein
MTLHCIFHPQAWINDYAVEVDPEGPVEWAMPWPDDAPIPKDDRYESDDLRTHENAPEWVRQWQGPFYVEVQENR